MTPERLTVFAGSPLKDENFGLLLRRVREALLREIYAAFEPHGIEINYSQFCTLKMLRSHGEVSPKELARALDHDAGAMTRVLDKLEGHALLKRRPHAEDRRALTIALTPKGRVLADKIVDVTAGVVRHAMRDLDAQERRQLMSLLERVLEGLERSDA